MEELKNLKITLKPYLNGAYDFLYADVTIELENPHLAAGDKVCDLWKMVAGVPGAELSEGGMRAEDADGTLPLGLSIEKDPTGFDKRVWRAERNTRGDVTCSYRFLPRDVTNVNRCHPYFDTIQEKNGALIPGVTSLAAVADGTYHITVSWDTSEMPEAAGAASIKGGSAEAFSFDGTPYDYTFTLYLVGKYHCTRDESGKYKVYWAGRQSAGQRKGRSAAAGFDSDHLRFFRRYRNGIQHFLPEGAL